MAATTESVSDSHFIEALAQDGQSGLKWRIRVIKAGPSGNNNLYPAAVLREAAPMFNGVRVFVKSDSEHINGAGKSFNQLIGGLANAQFVEANGGEIQADLTLLASAGEVPAKIKEAYDAGLSNLFGFSIDAEAQVKRSGKLREAKKFTKINSVDLIIEPGAGGELINLIEALNPEDPLEMKLKERMIEAIKAKHNGQLPAGLNVDDDEALTEAYAAAIQRTDLSDEKNASFKEAKQGEPDAADKLEQKIRLVEARAEARVLLTGSNLPAPIVDKLKKQFNDTTVFTVEQVTEAINAEREVLAKLTESGHVQGLGGTRNADGDAQADKITQMLDDFFDPSKKAMSFRECYVVITGDKGVTGLIQNCDLRRMREALGGEEHLREAISAVTFANVLGNSITRAMVADYNVASNYDDWRDLVSIVPITNFRTQERTRMGGYGNLPAVAENGGYNALSSPSDEKATYAISKRGGKETISIETIANDDVGAIRKVPQRMSIAAKRTLFEFVLDFLATNPTIYDAVALFHASHGNLGALALDASSLAAARLAMKKQAEAGSSKRLGLGLRHIYVPSDLEQTSFDLFQRGTNNDATFVQSLRPMVHVVDYWTDANNWFATADKNEVSLIELGFYNGQEEPELFVQDLPTQGSLFSNDQIVYKIRHIYGGVVEDYRGFYGAIVP